MVFMATSGVFSVHLRIQRETLGKLFFLIRKLVLMANKKSLYSMRLLKVPDVYGDFVNYQKVTRTLHGSQ